MDILKEIKKLSLQDKDILLLKIDSEYYTPHNIKALVDEVNSHLEEHKDKKIGTIAVSEVADISLLDDNQLLNLGLLKLNRLIETLGKNEFDGLMKRMGFEEQIPFQDPKPETKRLVEDEDKTTEKKYIVHSNENYPFDVLVKLYDVDRNECVDANDPWLPHHPKVRERYYHLYPRLDNNYELPKRKGR